MKNFVLMSVAAVALNACGNSPLLNHRTARDPARTNADAALNEVQTGDTAKSDCSLDFAISGLCAKIQWLAGPSGEGENAFLVRFWDREHGEVSGPYVDPVHEFSAQLWMTSMGHGSSPVKVTKVSTGIYKVTNVFFIMSGDWDIRLKLQSGGKLVEQAVYSLMID